MPTPIITQNVVFKGQPRPRSGVYTIKLSSACEILQVPMTQAIYQVYTVGDKWQVSVQPTGGALQIIYLEVTTQAKMDFAINSTPPTFNMEICLLKSLSKTPTYTLRVSMTDSTGTNIKALAPNTLLRLT